MDDRAKEHILTIAGGTSLEKTERIQSLWSGYGEISRYKIHGGSMDTVIVKQVQLPDAEAGLIDHPRGWQSDLSHQRKVKSYEVESQWYRQFSRLCSDACRIPKCFGVVEEKGAWFIVLEDLDASGLPVRKNTASIANMRRCLHWLAHFHATFLLNTETLTTETPYPSLWEVGCYWHLDTRPDELAALADQRLKAAANDIDKLLNQCTYQTLVHGDAKLANFCFSDECEQVAAVDFQYVGRGCGMKDVAYFIGSCLNAEECEQHADTLLDDYFRYLKLTMDEKTTTICAVDVEQQWRPLFSVAWADFHRFMKGWCPDHWKINAFSDRLTQQVLDRLDGEGE